MTPGAVIAIAAWTIIISLIAYTTIQIWRSEYRAAYRRRLEIELRLLQIDHEPIEDPDAQAALAILETARWVTATELTLAQIHELPETDER